MDQLVLEFLVQELEKRNDFIKVEKILKGSLDYLFIYYIVYFSLIGLITRYTEMSYILPQILLVRKHTTYS